MRTSDRFIINVVSNVGLLVLNFVVGIWFTPYLIGVLGLAVYGVAALAASVANYMTIFDSAINNAIGRFLAIELHKQDYEKANRTFNSALGMAFIIMLGLLPIILLIAWFSPQLFNVPEGIDAATRWVFLASLLSYALILLRSVFTSSPFANNRLDLLNSTLATSVVVRVLVTVLLLTLAAAPSLSHVGTGLIVGTAASLLVAVTVFRRLTPQLRVDRRLFSRAELGLLFGVSGWVFVNQLGSVLFLSIDQIIVNAALGPVVQGFYASALQWSILLRTLARTISTALAPVMVNLFAGGEEKRLAEASVTSVRLLGIAMALPVGFIAGMAQPLLRVWLGPEFESQAVLLVALILPLSVNLAVLPLFPAQVAYNRVKVPGIVSLAGGALNLLLALWWVRLDDRGLGVALASALVLTLKNALFTPLYAAHIQTLPRFTYLPSLLLSVVTSLAVMAISRWMADTFAINSWTALAASAVAVGLVYSVVVFALLLSRDERAALLSVVRRGKR